MTKKLNDLNIGSTFEFVNFTVNSNDNYADNYYMKTDKDMIVNLSTGRLFNIKPFLTEDVNIINE